MLPVVAGARETKKQIVLYTLVLVPLTLAPWALGVVGWVYLAAACALGAGLIVAALRVGWGVGDRPAKQMFAYSILYLFVLYAVMLVDKTPVVA
jgi:protoheme IX farnesyltransferase